MSVYLSLVLTSDISLSKITKGNFPLWITKTKQEIIAFEFAFVCVFMSMLMSQAFMDFFVSSFVLLYVASDDDNALQVLFTNTN